MPQYSFQQAPSPAQLNYQQQYQQQYQQHNPHQQIYQENPQKMSVMQKNALQQQQAKAILLNYSLSGNIKNSTPYKKYLILDEWPSVQASSKASTVYDSAWI